MNWTLTYPRKLNLIAAGLTVGVTVLITPEVFTEPVRVYLIEPVVNLKAERNRQLLLEQSRAIDAANEAKKRKELEEHRQQLQRAADAVKQRQQAQFEKENTRPQPLVTTPAYVYKINFGRHRYRINREMHAFCLRNGTRTWTVTINTYATVWISWAFTQSFRREIRYLSKEHKFVSNRPQNQWPVNTSGQSSNCLAVRTDPSWRGTGEIELTFKQGRG